MVEISIHMGTTVTRLASIADGMRLNIRRGLMKAGEVLQRRMVQNLSGKRTAGNPYPGWVTATLRRIVALPEGDYAIAVGPGRESSSYAAAQEYGATINQTISENRRVKMKDGWVTLAAGRTLTIRIPARPYARPSAEQTRDQIVDAIANSVLPK